jgi:hypothetical protein
MVSHEERLKSGSNHVRLREEPNPIKSWRFSHKAKNCSYLPSAAKGYCSAWIEFIFGIGMAFSIARLMNTNKSEAVPPAWDYNPSSWSQRVPLVVIAAIGFLIALYLGLYQVGLIQAVWEPFFDDGSARVLNSSISKALPIPDGLLGSFGYLLDVVTGVVGKTDRWRSKPWIVILFSIAMGPLGLTSVMLVIFQPVLVGAWCTLCIVTAIISVVMISPAMDELLASLQFLQREKRKGGSLWRLFWGRTNTATQ